ncbi:hypothetical protein EDD15DRAFT_2411188 [Pisolithus albus]|nr:hypothetical protein EDD15DRAFT_2411188 [Pisolithus albus]
MPSHQTGSITSPVCESLSSPARATRSVRELISSHGTPASHPTLSQQGITSSPHGFASISRRRTSLKPIIAAVNGPAYGGGVEIILRITVRALACLPEIGCSLMHSTRARPWFYLHFHSYDDVPQLASEMLLLGNTITALEARDKYRLVAGEMYVGGGEGEPEVDSSTPPETVHEERFLQGPRRPLKRRYDDNQETVVYPQSSSESAPVKGGSEAKMGAENEAYEVLGSPIRLIFGSAQRFGQKAYLTCLSSLKRIEGAVTTTWFPLTLEYERGDRDIDATSDSTGLIYIVGSRIDENGPH